jgi:CHAT domain-containing protein/tetratricopeptide (TPR) repeat protein
MRRSFAFALAAVLTASDIPGPRVSALPQDQTIRDTLDRGQYEEAERHAADWHAQVKKTHGPDSLELARASDLLVEALLKNGRGADANVLDIAQAAVRGKERALGHDHVDVSESLHKVAAVLSARGDFRAALPLHERALALRQRLLSADSPAIADSLDSVAGPLIELEKFSAALELLNRSLRIRRLSSDQTSRSLARTLELVGRAHWRAGGYAEAAEALDGALAISDRLWPGHPDKVMTLTLRGEVHHLGGDVLAARRTWLVAADLAQRVLRPDHPLQAVTRRRLAHGETAVGNLSEARRLREDGLRIAEGSLTSCDPEMAAQLNDLGGSRFDDGNFAAARALYRRKASLVEKCRGAVNDAMATTVYNLFEVAREMGANADAATLGARAIRIWSQALGATHPFVAYGAYQLATFETSQKRFGRARTLFEQSLRIRMQALGPKHPDVALTLIPYARMLGETGNVARARSLLQEAIAILTVTPARAPDALANAFEVRAALEESQGDLAAAHASLAEALAAKERIYASTHPLVALTRAELAQTDFALAAYDSALASALAAEQAGRDLLRFTVRSLPERRALEFAAKRPRGLDLTLSVAAVQPATDIPQVLDAVIQSRGIVLDELAARAQSITSTDPKLTTLARARERVASLTLRSLQGETVPLALLADAQKLKEDAEEAFAEQSVALRGEQLRARSGLVDVRRALPPRAALVSFVRYDRTTFTAKTSPRRARLVPSYMAFITRSGKDEIAVVRLGSASSVEDAIAKWRGEVDGRTLASSAAAADTERTYRLAATRLRARLWDPIAAHLSDTDRVFIVADGAINTVSFATLPVGRRQYVIESSPVLHYLTTERDLLSADQVSTARGLLAVGGPAYGQSPSPVQPTSTVPGCGAGPLVFEDLPGSRAEVRDIARLWAPSESRAGEPTAAPTVLSGQAANKAAVMRMAEGRRVVHLATHGFFLGAGCTTPAAHARGIGGLVPVRSSNTDDNPLLLSGLALAGANRRSTRAGTDNGILTAEEIVSLKLKGTEWAVLSACGTGLGEIKAGEGVFGLRRAFQIAGVRTVITSLWSVEDQSTRVWMRALYEGRLQRQLSTADAVREAGLQVLRARRSRGQSAHPFYWGAFVAAGDWR